jgi:hypothetical protein
MQTALDHFARDVIVPGVNADVNTFVRQNGRRSRDLFVSLARAE